MLRKLTFRAILGHLSKFIRSIFISSILDILVQIKQITDYSKSFLTLLFELLNFSYIQIIVESFIF